MVKPTVSMNIMNIFTDSSGRVSYRYLYVA
jgi:hypothetical protein